MKQCNVCKELKSILDFPFENKAKNTYHGKCKSCYAAYHRIWRSQNVDKSTANTKRYRNKNSAKHNQYMSLWRAKNYEKNKENVRNWIKNNPEKKNAQAHRRRAQKLNNGIFEIRQKEISKIYASPCVYCGTLSGITADHIIPLSRGGRHSIGNLTSACSKCNSSKGSKTITEWKLLSRKGK